MTWDDIFEQVEDLVVIYVPAIAFQLGLATGVMLSNQAEKIRLEGTDNDNDSTNSVSLE